jgi:large subunit ribosomal protein L10
MGFAFEDSVSVVKAVSEFTKSIETLKIKGGYLEAQAMSADEIRTLAEVPPLPVLRGQLLGLLMTPANKLVRTLAEPGRQLATVLQAYSEKTATAA